MEREKSLFYAQFSENCVYENLIPIFHRVDQKNMVKKELILIHCAEVDQRKSIKICKNTYELNGH